MITPIGPLISMILTKVSSKKVTKQDGILYVVHFKLDGKELVKIGVTSRSIEDRVSEILVSIFKAYREFPYCRPKRFRKTENMYDKESQLHEYFKDCKYVPQYKFGGCTEFFDVSLEEVVEVYERLLDGEDIGSRQKQSDESM